LTRDLIAACHPVGVEVLDHIILVGNSYYSFAEEGLLAQLALETLAPVPAKR
jgi:DNA repair protein RadC